MMLRVVIPVLVFMQADQGRWHMPGRCVVGILMGLERVSGRMTIVRLIIITLLSIGTQTGCCPLQLQLQLQLLPLPKTHELCFE